MTTTSNQPSSSTPSAGGSSMMSDAALVFRREFLTRITSSMFLASLGFALVMIIGGTAFVKLQQNSDTDTVGIVGDQPAGVVEALPQLAEDAGFDPVEVVSFDTRAELEQAITDGDVRVGIVDGDELVVKTKRGTLPGFLALVWQEAKFGELVANPELDAAQQTAIVDATAELPLTELEPDPESGARRGVGVALVVLLFLTIQLMGGMLLMSITEEKGNNIVELLLSSMSSKALLIGKLAANGLVGLIQVVILIGTAIVAVNVANLGDLPTIPPSLLLVALVWFVIGFAFFGVLIAAGASLAPSQEDAQSVLMPVFMVVLAGYFASVFVASNPDAGAARAVSMLPFVSPFVMPSRFLADELPWWEHGLAFAIALVALVAVLQLGARVYTRSVIHTDRKLGWLEAFRAEPVR